MSKSNGLFVCVILSLLKIEKHGGYIYEKEKRICKHPVANTFTVWLLFCAIAFSVVMYIQTASTQMYIKDKIVEIEIAYEKICSEAVNVTESQISEM